MKRVEFLKVMGAGTLAALAGGALNACKSSSTTPSNPATSHDFTSTTTLSHAHTFTVQQSEIQTPPAAGISRQTSNPTDAYTGAHTHTFTMTQADLTNVKNGTPVTISTADTNSHHHDFTISKWY